MTFSGAKKSVLIGMESTIAWGTIVTQDKDIGLVQDISDNITREIIESKGLGAIETQYVNTGSIEAGASLTAEFQHSRLFSYILGTVSHTSSGTDFKHTFTIADQAPSFTLLSGDTDQATSAGLIISGCLVESAELSIALNEVLKLKVELKGKTLTSTSTVTTASIDVLPVFPHMLCSVELDTVAASEIQNFSVKFNKKIELSGGLKSIVPQQGHATDLGFEFSGQLGFQDDTYDKLFISGTTSTTLTATANPAVTTVELIADNGTAYGSGQRFFQITLANCQFSTWNKTCSVGGLTFVDFGGKGTFSSCYGVDDISATAGGGNWE